MVFDSIVLSENAWAGMVDKLEFTETKSVYFGYKIIVCKFVPDNIMLLRQGGKVVAIVRIGDERTENAV